MTGLTRRGLMAGLPALAGVSLGAGLARQFGLFREAWPPTPYDDLLGRLALRDEAVTLGRAVLAALPRFDAAQTARRLRAGFRRGGSLAALAARDADSGRVVEIAGWVIPETVADLSALAAASAPQGV